MGGRRATPDRTSTRGRPRTSDRACFDASLWILRTGAQWIELPSSFLPKSTVHDRFQSWNRSGALARALKALADVLIACGKLDLSECFVDATFASAKKGGPVWARPGVAKAARSWSSQTALVFLSSYTWRVLPRMTTLVTATLEGLFTSAAPERLIGDRAYDSDGIDRALAERGIEMIAPHKRNRRRRKTQDGRRLRRYRRRWKVERLFAWLLSLRRVTVRWERHVENYVGFVHLGCLVMLLRLFSG